MTQNRRIALNIMATYERMLVCAGDWLVLRMVGADGAWSDGLWPDGLTAVKMVKYTAK